MDSILKFNIAVFALGSGLEGGNTAQSATQSHEQVVSRDENLVESARSFIQEWSVGYPEVEQKFNSFIENLKENQVEDFSRIVEAIQFEAYKHRFQTRKDPKGTPYMIHPMGVADNILMIGGVKDPNVLIAALLHDTVEDTETSFEEIEQKFGRDVVSLVREVTDDKSLPKQMRKDLQIEHALHVSPGAALIKLADKLYNLSDLERTPPPDWSKERVDQYFQWSDKVVSNLPDVNEPLKRAVKDLIESHS